MITVIAQEGEIKTVDRPKPQIEPNFVLVETAYSAISPGTEMGMKKKTGANPVKLGYSASGTVAEVGEGVLHVRPGDKVACYGAPFVHHAGFLLVPKHLVTRVPEVVPLEEAAYAGLGAIAIHALRQADLHFGENVVVAGLGALGQIVCQIAEAASFHVIGHDLIPFRCDKLREAGVGPVFHSPEEMEKHIDEQTNGVGVDAVVLCASGHLPELINASLRWIRDRGKIIIVGDLKMDFDRELMFGKEAQVLISRAGGPGRYDRQYEVAGTDYPIGYVRWTEGRNVAEFVRLLAANKLQVGSLISQIVPVEEAGRAYDRFAELPERTIGVVFEYGADSG